MNKPLAIFVVVLLSISYASAQQKPGTLSITPKLGATLSGFNNNMPAQVRYVIYPILDSQTGLPVMDINNPPLNVGVELYDNSDKMGLTIGVEGQYQMTSALGLSFGAFYTQEGARYTPKQKTSASNLYQLTLHDDINTYYHCITVPILAQLYVWKGLSLKAGLQPDFAIYRRNKNHVTIDYLGESYDIHSKVDANIRGIALSAPVGICYEYKKLVADLRYCFGLTNLRKDGIYFEDHSGIARGHAMTLTLGYKIQFNKQFVSRIH